MFVCFNVYFTRLCVCSFSIDAVSRLAQSLTDHTQFIVVHALNVIIHSTSIQS